MGKVTKFTVQKIPRFTVTMPPASKINLKDKYEDGEIDLSMSDLETVPVKEIAVFKKAYSLDLSNNRLSILPKNFIILTNITKLDLSKNELKELPENFGELNKLKHLDLYRNQLKHLPLSFSKLKALKWLDLKDNPLVPAIAEAAGPCLDSKQCQQCAKDIVVFYTRLEEKVEHERSMREKQRQKDLLANELAQQKQKQQEKKNKKKEKAKQKQQNLEETNSLSSNQDSKPKKGINKTRKDKKTEKPPSFIVKFIKFTLFTTFFSMLILFLLTSVHFTHTRFIEHTVQETWSNILASLCPDIHPYALQVGQLVHSVHTQTGLFIMKVAEYVTAFQNSNPIYKRLVEVYKDIFDTSNFYEDTLQ